MAPPASRPPPGPNDPPSQGRARGRAVSTPSGPSGPPTGPPSRPGPPPAGPGGRGTMPSSVARGGPPGAVTKSPPGGPPAAAGGRGTVRGAPVTATSRGTAPPPGQPQAVGRAAPAVARGAPPAGPPQQVRPPPGATAAQPAGRAVFRADGRGGVAPPGAGRPTAGIAQAMKAVTIGSSGAGSSSARGSEAAIGRGASRGRQERQSTILRTRPESLDSKQGSSGDAVQIVSNFFALKTPKDWKLYQYRVDIAPEEDETRLRKKYVRQLKERLGQYIFDGTVLYTPQKYVQEIGQTVTGTASADDGSIITVTIKMVGELGSGDMSFIQFFNIILRKCMEGLNLQLLGRNYFDPKANIKLPAHRLELWPGYVTSIRQHELGILLCCETSNKIIRTETVLDQMRVLARGGGDFQRSAMQEFVGQIVMTRYNNKTYKVDDIDFKESPLSTFPRKDDSQQSYMDYYKEKYGLTIKDPKQPLLVSLPKAADIRRGNTKPLKLIPELCSMTGLSDEQRANFKLMKDLGEYTRTAPDKRVTQLQRFAQRMNTTPEIQQELKSWGLQIDTNLQMLKGRLLPPETIGQGQGRTCNYDPKNADWGNAFRDFKLFNAVACNMWAIVYPPKLELETKEFLKCLQRVGPGMGFMLKAPKMVTMKDDRTGSYVQTLNKLADMKPEMIMAVVPNNKGDNYHAIKKLLCIEKPLPSQVMTGTVLKKPKGLLSVATKVAIQMASKLGGEPWSVTMPLKDTMVIGYDSYHDSSQKAAVGAVVSSINSTMTRYTSSCTIHKNNEELLDQMKTCVMKALNKYKEHNKTNPQRIIVYRDGVGDGQIEYVKFHEIPAFRECFASLSFDPKFTFIIVSKRINTKFFTKRQGMDNPFSGTVIDDVVTLPERYDFFLVSQSVRQGTVNPTSYNIIEDTSGLRPDHIQKLTYKMTHLYYNWPGTVRVPAPCQYAHKLAFLVGESLHRYPSNNLEDLLYYL